MVTRPLSASANRAPLLLDRAGELDELSATIGEVVEVGEGLLLAIEGQAGIGKTVLLAELARHGRDAGMQVLSARAGEFERGYGFGIVRQLLEPVLLGVGAGERDKLLDDAARLAEPVFDVASAPEDGAQAEFARLHGLHWLVANLAERGPVLLVVDDVQWADEPSLRFLDHLARRLSGLPVLVALAIRTGEDAERPLLQSMVLEARTRILRPRPLGSTAVQTLVRTRLDPAAGDELCLACQEVSLGNPFLLTELIAELRHDVRPVDALDPASVRQMAPARVGAAVLMRVGRIDPDAPALARALAVLGEHASLVTAAALAELAPARAAEVRDALAGVAVLEPGEPLRFVHPLVRTAVYQDIAPARRSDLHARAAVLLTGQHAPPESVAVHLLATHPAGDPHVVDALRAAARAATTAGAPDTARALLQRALTEPPGADQRLHVLFELGRAEAGWGTPAAGDHLREVYETADDPVLRARALILLGDHLVPNAPRLRDLFPLYETAARAVAPHDRSLELQLELARLVALQMHPDLPARIEDEVERFRDLPMTTVTEIDIHSFFARTALATGDAAAAVAIAERVAVQPTISGQVGWARLNTTLCLIATERYDLAERELTRAVHAVALQGLPKLVAAARWQRSLVRHSRGDLRGAESDARTSLDARDKSVPYTVTMAVSRLICPLIDQGRTAEAEALVVEHKIDGELPRAQSAIFPLIIRGRLRAAAGEPAAARADLEEAMRRLRAGRWHNPSEFDARIPLVTVLLALGDTDGAATLAEETLQRARAFGVAKAVGGALRVAGLVHGGQPGLALLQEAVDVLAESPSLLWRAEALVDHGAALRRAGRRSAAGAQLRAGMDLAHRCGATPLADRAADELRTLGHRIHRRATTGAEALTSSERRVAELAADGLTNKQIAQALFVTLRTVEVHLSHSYTKLGITSRDGLTTALATTHPPHPD
ncbi:ATP-binding protein [Pseudonocardia sp. TRM90224]|uniref:ATP-binding protein n=1 Tax=Pseudonocardia sp. TRM90224 TaxID=2812678 RepID=UPI001E50CE7C|nr:AAA family ATPase [Pseudonocardia sp. TRM90224]